VNAESKVKCGANLIPCKRLLCFLLLVTPDIHTHSPLYQSLRENTSTVSSTSPPYRLAEAPGKNHGLFATRPIATGELIISEAPLFTAQGLFEVGPAVQKLSAADKAIFETLTDAYCADKPTPVTRFKTNALPLGVGSTRGGLFPQISRINHSRRNRTSIIRGAKSSGRRSSTPRPPLPQVKRSSRPTLNRTLRPKNVDGSSLPAFGSSVDATSANALILPTTPSDKRSPSSETRSCTSPAWTLSAAYG
jgi:hypothetical protein